MADFRVTDRDLYEFNAWIKGRVKSQPRLRSKFSTDEEYEEYMINYQENHMTLDNDPAVIQKDYSKNREKVSAEILEKAKTEGVVQKKPNGKWGIISIKAGEWWTPDYDTKENAENALQAYHANKGFSTPRFTWYRNDDGSIMMYKGGWGLVVKDGKYIGIDGHFDPGEPALRGYHRCSNPGIDIKSIVPEDGLRTFEDYTGVSFFSDNSMVEVKFRTTNPEQLTRIVKAIGEHGNVGHMLEIAVDYDDENQEVFGWDGDGSDRIDLDSVKSFSFAEDGRASAFEIVGMILHSIADFHLFHLLTTDYGAHKALEDYYDGMPELVDAFAEDNLSVFDKDDVIKFEWYNELKLNNNNPISYLLAMLGIIGDFREATKDTLRDSQKSELDAIEQLMNSTMYKLKRLSAHENRSFTFA